MSTYQDFPPLAKIAQALGGDARGFDVLAPGPGHSREDRSMSVRPDEGAPDGFLVHSFAGDDPIACKKYVIEKLGLKPKGNGAAAPGSRFPSTSTRRRPASPICASRSSVTPTARNSFRRRTGRKRIKGKPAGEKILIVFRP